MEGGGAQKLIVVAMLVAIASNFNGVCNAQSSICNVSVNGFLSCRPAVTAPNPVPPTATCCAALLHADIPCLCLYRSFMPSFGVDPNLAFQLPAQCKLDKPHKCDIGV